MAVNVVLKSVWDDKGIKEATSSLNKISDGIGTTFKAVGIATAVATAAIVKFGADSIAAAENVAQANNRLGQVAQSMGIFGSQTEAVTQRLIDFAEANELTVAVDAEVIKATQAKLLTFKNLAQTADDMGGSFDRATLAALDLAAAGFGSAETNAVQLGKALQDPIKGITALARSGVTFTEQEREKIKVLVESGKTLEAQELILKAIETQVGGTAQATAKASDRMKLAFDNISEAVGEAMLPAYEDMVDIIINDIIPIFTDIAEDVGPAMADALEFIAEVFDEAMTEGTDLNKALGKLEDSFGLLFSAITNGQNDAEGFADFLANLVLIVEFLTTSLAAIIAGFQGIGIALDALSRGDFDTFFKFLTMDTIEFVEAMKGAEGAANDLNNVDLKKFRSQLGDTRVDVAKLTYNAMQLGKAMQGKIIPDYKPPGGDDGPLGDVESSFEKVQKFIKKSQDELTKAQEKYNKTLFNAQKKYKDAIEKTERDFANKLANIIQQSQDRLRTAFASVARISLTDIFEVEETKSVANLVAGLTNRLKKSQALLERAGKLNAAGFSQTFIEQVVAAGTETGNELAQAILDATPETQRELQSLFSAIETTAETGMDSLARQIYESAGLATRELRNLYAQTQTELTDALLKLKEDFDQEVLDANTTLLTAIKEISKEFAANIATMKGDLGGLDAAVLAFQNKLKNLETATAQTIASTTPGATGGGQTGGATGLQGVNLAASAVNDATGILIDSASDVAKVLDYLALRIDAANTFANQMAIAGRTTEAMGALESRNLFQSQANLLRAQGAGAVGTVININVKTDSTQSLAMVGKSLGNTITKYVQTGGQVVVSPVG